MTNSFPEIYELLDTPEFQSLKILGFIDEIALRNFIIKTEYKNLRVSQSQIDSIFFLSEKYKLSFDTVNSILFRKRPDRQVFFPTFN